MLGHLINNVGEGDIGLVRLLVICRRVRAAVLCSPAQSSLQYPAPMPESVEGIEQRCVRKFRGSVLRGTRMRRITSIFRNSAFQESTQSFMGGLSDLTQKQV